MCGAAASSCVRVWRVVVRAWPKSVARDVLQVVLRDWNRVD